MAKLVPSRVIDGTARLVETYGQDPELICQRIGLNIEALYNPDILISQLAVSDLFEECAQRCNDRFFTLKLAQLQGLDMLGPIWLLMRNAKTVGEALEVFAANIELHASGQSVYIDRQKRGISLSLEIRKLKLAPREKRPVHTHFEQVIDHWLALCIYELRRMLGNRWRPDYVQLRCTQPDQIAPLQLLCGDNLYFNQDVNAIHINQRDFEHTLANDAIHGRQVIEHELGAGIGYGLPFVLRVDRMIRLLINTDSCTAIEVANAMNMKLRTLQYRLKLNQSSYRLLYDEARLDLAQQYIRTSELSIGAIAERLHFKDNAAFTSFYKRVTGRTPTEYRRWVLPS
jgi:AraC-like DNA-binding protein